MAWPLVAAILASTALSIYGKKKETDSQINSINDQIELNEEKKKEIDYRRRVNNTQLIAEAQAFRGEQLATAAANGIDVGSGACHMVMEDTALRLSMQLVNNRRQAMYEKRMVEMENEGYRRKVYETKEASRWGMITSGLQGGTSAATSYSK